MASCLLEAINSGTLNYDKKHLTLWSDNCGGQLKNRMLVFLYMWLIQWEIFDTIQHNFLLTGHSYSSADRDFGVIEKRAKLSRMQVMNDVKEAILSARVTKPFKVLEMQGKFLDFDSASAKYLDTKPLQISKITSMKLTNTEKGAVFYKKTYGGLEAWNKVQVLKKGVQQDDVSKFLLNKLDDGVELSQAKKNDIAKMIPYLDENNKEFYRKLVA